MYGLPKSTEVAKQLPKAAIYRKYNLSAKDQQLIDAEVARIDIVNEISPRTTTMTQGEKVASFFIVKVQLKRVDYNAEAISRLFNLIGQKCVFALTILGKVSFACYNQRLFCTSWQNEVDGVLSFSGIDLDRAWDNIQASVVGVEHIEETSLDFQVTRKIKLMEMTRSLEKLKKCEKKEIQPRRKQEFHSKVVELKKEIEELQGNPLMA